MKRLSTFLHTPSSGSLLVAACLLLLFPSCAIKNVQTFADKGEKTTKKINLVGEWKAIEARYHALQLAQRPRQNGNNQQLPVESVRPGFDKKSMAAINDVQSLLSGYFKVMGKLAGGEKLSIDDNIDSYSKALGDNNTINTKEKDAAAAIGKTVSQIITQSLRRKAVKELVIDHSENIATLIKGVNRLIDDHLMASLNAQRLRYWRLADNSLEKEERGARIPTTLLVADTIYELEQRRVALESYKKSMNDLSKALEDWAKSPDGLFSKDALSKLKNAADKL